MRAAIAKAIGSGNFTVWTRARHRLLKNFAELSQDIYFEDEMRVGSLTWLAGAQGAAGALAHQ
ncbi:hypothetical protein MKJ04_16735 [Pontibacter sp. E15-1]|uniref:hypothetical protein n=1 Tax=Pontibacter sp. E15-1 TaxID=2919918 RepID=UPI001F4F813B|nr:hypothetical protein [Pontibacter sp. E15-1]MCJ8166493.1 hypothetical protein [Pontibacter sp. E15-1]